jgi:hypothetical protein
VAIDGRSVSTIDGVDAALGALSAVANAEAPRRVTTLRVTALRLAELIDVELPIAGEGNAP